MTVSPTYLISGSKKILGLLMLGIWLLGACKKVKKADPDKPTIFSLFQTADLIDFELTTSLDSLLINRSDEVYQHAQLNYFDSNGMETEMNIVVSSRGKTRRSFCTYPPLRLKFAKADLKEAGFAKFKTLKLVMPCKADSIYEDYVLREFLCYHLYNILTPYSFRVQLVRVNLKDQEGIRNPVRRLGFLIEHEDEMAVRLGGTLSEESESHLQMINADLYHKLVVFQYMIGNTDWNLSQGHNIKLVQIGEDGVCFPVPYDFDYSGLVNAEYAIPHPDLPVEQIRDRYFQWRGKDTTLLQETIGLVRAKKPDVLQQVDNLSFLSLASKTDITNYLGSFFSIVEIDGAAEKLAGLTGESTKQE